MGCRCDGPGHCFWRGKVIDLEQFEACRKDELETAPDSPLPCIYLGRQINVEGKRIERRLGGRNLYECRLLGDCVLESGDVRKPACSDCLYRLSTHSRDLSEKWLDPLKITDRHGKTTDSLRNMLCDGAAFLVAGGPSLKELPIQRLRERGVFSLGVNNVSGWAPVDAFVCSDPPIKFHWGIFTDPKIIKLMPRPKMRHKRGQLRKKLASGKFRDLEMSTPDCPNIYGFERRSWLMPDDTWFSEDSAAWGNHNKGVDKTGELKTVATCLLGLRLLQYLGAKTIFLLGHDFRMQSTVGEFGNYAFKQGRTEGAINNNNRQLTIVADWLTKLRPIFEKYGFQTYNCNPTSSLRAFDYVPFETALKIVKGQTPDEPFDLEGWYDHKDCDADSDDSA